MNYKLLQIITKLCICLALFMGLFSCEGDSKFVRINQESIALDICEYTQLDYSTSSSLLTKKPIWSVSNDNCSITDSGILIAKKSGNSVVSIELGGLIDTVEVMISDELVNNFSFDINDFSIPSKVSEIVPLDGVLTLNNMVITSDIEYKIINNNGFASIQGNSIISNKEGTVSIIALYDNIYLGECSITFIKSYEDTPLTINGPIFGFINEPISLSCSDCDCDISYEIISGQDLASISDNVITPLSEGVIQVVGHVQDRISNVIEINIYNQSILDDFEINANKYFVNMNDEVTLSSNNVPSYLEEYIEYVPLFEDSFSTINDNTITFNDYGTISVIGKIGNITSDVINIYVVDGDCTPTSVSISCDDYECEIGSFLTLFYEVIPSNAYKNIEYTILKGSNSCIIKGNTLLVTGNDEISIMGVIDGVCSNIIKINEPVIDIDPYTNVDVEEFYENYTRASNSTDAYYRSLHGLMSGDIEPQDQSPTSVSYQPKEDCVYLRNTHASYSTDKMSYYIVDGYGNVVSTIYKEGAYVSLEDVAAYILAFGDVPCNYLEQKSSNPSESIWKEYLRLNHSYFGYDKDRYKYEPMLPKIFGADGDLLYYEIDLGTTGTDCDPNYPAKVYNNGTKISRGAARLVYTRYDANEDEIIDINEKYVFYTYNHYNDFQEYLNYYGGWGEKFGNITGGGTISSNTLYNPTPYVKSKRVDFVTTNMKQYEEVIVDIVYYYVKKEDYAIC